MQEHDATHREGAPDSFAVLPDQGWHFYSTVTDTAGNESCASNIVYVPGTVTGVEPGPGGDPVVSVTLYDVQGRRVRQPSASGVYYRVLRHRSGLVSRKRVVVVK